jgi:hypothetical protein
MKKQIIISVIIFLALIPFRLPISVILIKGFTWINTMSTSGLTLGILSSNVAMTKGVYDAILSAFFLVNVRNLFLPYVNNREDVNFSVFGFGGVIMAFYAAYDISLTYDLAKLILT